MCAFLKIWIGITDTQYLQHGETYTAGANVANERTTLEKQDSPG